MANSHASFGIDGGEGDFLTRLHAGRIYLFYANFDELYFFQNLRILSGKVCETKKKNGFCTFRTN